MLIIKLVNVSRTSDIADYTYGVYVNDRRIANGRVMGHKRSDGWPVLIEKMLKVHSDTQAHV